METGTMYFLYTSDDTVTFNFSADSNYDAYYYDNGQEHSVVNNSYTLSNLLTKAQNNYGYDTEFVFKNNQQGDPQDPQDPQNTGNTTATVDISGTNYANASIFINDSMVELPWPANPDGESTEVRYDYEAGKVTFRFATLFIQKFTSITVNGHNVPIGVDYTNREDYLNHYNHQMVSFEAEIDKADNYVIVANIENADENSCYVGNFLWTGDANQEYILDPDGNPIIDSQTGEKLKNDNYIGHSKLELVKVQYERNGATVTRDFTNNNELDAMDLGEYEMGPGRYSHDYTDGDLEYGYITKENNQTINYDDGSLVVPEGALVTMKIVPEYGYQVTSFGINGSSIITGNNISEFTFPVTKGTFHLGAQVTKVDDTVDAKADAIKSGSISLGGAEIDAGTVELSVDDTTITNEQKANFENAANGYNIDSYVDINLNQVFYKGSSNSKWYGDELTELNNEATISLELENGVDGNDVALVHEKHDGTYEVIPTTFNSENNTLTFKTDEFSNYAIAYRTVTNPSTSDKVAIFAGIFVIALAGIGVTTVKLRKVKN